MYNKSDEDGDAEMDDKRVEQDSTPAATVIAQDSQGIATDVLEATLKDVSPRFTLFFLFVISRVQDYLDGIF